MAEPILDSDGRDISAEIEAQRNANAAYRKQQQDLADYDAGKTTHAPAGHKLHRRKLFDVIFRGMAPQRWQEPWAAKAESSSPGALAAALRRLRAQSRGQSLMAAILAPKAPVEPKAPGVPPTPSLLAGT